MFRKRKVPFLKEDSPNCYKLFIKYAKYISLTLAIIMVFT
jgi:hypothetical protein